VVFHRTARIFEIAAGTALWTVFTLALMFSDGSTVENVKTTLMSAWDSAMVTFLVKMFLSGR
jgi:hypothetical protein